MKSTTRIILIMILAVFCQTFVTESVAQKRKKKKDNTEEKSKHFLDTLSVSGLKFRSVGPAITSGRISDFAIHPDNHAVWYVATSSGGVWKTNNAGTTFSPIFDGEGSYSIGCVTIDPHNPNVVWVGTGENNNQRSVAYGDGVYKSVNGGRSWKQVGLKHSEHISKIIVHPEDPNTVYVAAYGPLWNAGGDRGIYRTSDGGSTWDTLLYVSKHTGFSDLVMDPRNPDVMYAAAHQRRRHVFTYHGGGPESGIYKTIDGGETWMKANNGLPGGDKGRIGLAISPANPEILYAIVEASGGDGGFYRSMNRAASWEKRSSYVTSGNYYQEIVACPHDEDRIFSMNTYLHVSTDGGKTFKNIEGRNKHVDNHCMWIDPDDSDHWLLGCDGGIYKTYDGAVTWDYFPNLPVTQFYKVAVDNDKPFYNIYGGTQDNYSMGGPARSTSANGIVNSDWYMTHGGDGFESQIDPEFPDIVYAQAQYGVLVRYDHSNGEYIGIQPKERKGENAYRWNWDAPLAVSHHDNERIYFAANKLFRSDDRGDNWTVLGDDLTRQIDRNKLKVMGQVWGIDAVTKHRSTSPYGTIVAFSESPLNEQLLYVGTDDGLIQITEDGGENWTTVSSFPGVPDTTYVNMVYASRHDEQVVYACFNHHKYGDFKPYVYKSNDKGRTWTSISSNLPERGSAYCIEEDHVDPDLLFVGTEFGAFFSVDGGDYWKQLKAGLPTIAVRDMDIQERENDLVLGTFGRGFYVLDDYAPLRELSEETAQKQGHIYPVRTALLFNQRRPLGGSGKAFQGNQYYTAENLGPVALIAYSFTEDIKTLRQERKKAEKDMKDVYNPSYEDYKAEREEVKPYLSFTIRNASGEIVREIRRSTGKGLKRFEWDLRVPSKQPVRASGEYNPMARTSTSHFVLPGTYTVEMSKTVRGETTKLTDPMSFEVKYLNEATVAVDLDEALAFRAELDEVQKELTSLQHHMRVMNQEVTNMRRALDQMTDAPEGLSEDVMELDQMVDEIRIAIYGDPVARALEIETPPSLSSRFSGWTGVYNASSRSTAPPTGTQRMVLEIIREEMKDVADKTDAAMEDMEALQRRLETAGAPYVPGRY